MRVLRVHPHEGVDNIRFGASRADVERALGLAAQRLRRGPFALEGQFFDSLGLYVSYDECGSCNAVSVARGLGTDWEYDGYLLLAHPAHEVRSWASARDPEIEAVDGFTSKRLGLHMWADWLDQDDLSVEEVAAPASAFVVFRPGYYEQEEARVRALKP